MTDSAAGLRAEIVKLLYRVAAEAVNNAQEEAPYRTGNLRNDIKVYDDRIGRLEIRIGNSRLAPYAVFVHEGTGLYGPEKRVIRPKSKRALRTPYGPRAWVRGQRANRYMVRGFKRFVARGLPRVLEAATGSVGKAAADAIGAAVKDLELKLEI